MALSDILKGVAGAALNVAAAAGCVQTWSNYRYEAACNEIDSVVVSALRTGDQGYLDAILQAFADEIRDADTPETQTHLNDLLIHFKLRLAQISVAAGAAGGGSIR